MSNQYKAYLLPTTIRANKVVFSPICMVMKDILIDSDKPENVRHYRKNTLVNTHDILRALCLSSLQHNLEHLLQFHLHIVSNDEIFEDDVVLINERTVGKFKELSASGCDAIFYEEGIGFNGNKPNAEKWLQEHCQEICGSTNKDLGVIDISPEFIYYYIECYNATNAIILIPEDIKVQWNARVQEFRNNISTKKDIHVSMIGMTPPDIALIGAGTLAHDEIIQRRREAGLIPNEEFYTRQDMIEFANKAIYDYIGSKGLLVDSKLKLNADWITDNLPKY